MSSHDRSRNQVDVGSTAAFRLSALVLPFYVPSILSFLGVGMVVPLLALFARHVGASVAEAGFIVGLFGLGHVLFNIPAGLLISRFGMRRTLISATVLEGLLAAALGFVENLVPLAILVFLLGCVHTVYYVTRISFFRALVPASHRGRSLALIGGSNRFGQFLGPIVGGIVAEVFGFRYLFWLFSALMMASLVFLVLWVPRVEPSRSGQTGTHWISRTREILRTNARTFLTAGSAIIVLQLLRTARQVLIPLVGEAVGLGVSEIGFVFGMMYLLELLFFYPAGIAMDRFGRKATAVPCLAFFALAFSFLPFVTGFISLLAVSLVAGVGNGLGSGINMTLSTDFAPERNPGEFIGVWRFIVDAGTAGGPFLVGAVAAALSLGGAAVTVAVLGVAGATMMGVFVPEPLHRTAAADKS